MKPWRTRCQNALTRAESSANAIRKPTPSTVSRNSVNRMFEAKKKENFDQIYSNIAEELRSQYMLGYTPDKSSADASYHKIILTTKKKDLYVQTRDGYYADK